ncbi:MAG: 50S ribosomal protein L22 [Candidatus Omnitrophica bacterium]|nr:50S ribosomal protein L22 [Candidatus Omnitrophota bacterium]MDD5574309.1 50S ribosomal protein L22 [Candidatus Omnitrophota bacterium]
MIARAEVRYIRGSARKIRQVLDLVRGMNAAEAVHFLRFINKRPTYYISKVLRSAIANAKSKGLDAQELVISKITADEGPRWKRFRAATFGRAGEILKKTSHITVELDLGREVVAAPPKVAPAAPKKPEKKSRVAGAKKKK